MNSQIHPRQYLFQFLMGWLINRFDILIFLPAVAVIFFTSCSQTPVKIACVGDSITEGIGIRSMNEHSYPVILSQLLGSEYEVMNFGRSSATMLKKSNFSFWDTKDFFNLFNYQPDIVIIKLGTNDTKGSHWNAQGFEADCQDMIDTINTMHSRPEIFLCYPVPVFADRWEINDSTMQVGVIPIIKEIASVNNIKTIDLYTGLNDHPDFFMDGVHPNRKGAALMAEIISTTLFIKDK